MAERESAGPTHRVDTVIRREVQDDYWLNIGFAFPHKDGNGLLCLITLPVPVATAQDHLQIVAAPEIPPAGQIQNELAVIGAGIVVGAAIGYLLPFRVAVLLLRGSTLLYLLSVH